MNYYNEKQNISSTAENRNPIAAQVINAYLKQQAANQNVSGPQQDILRKMLQNEQGNSLLKNYVNNVCEAIMKNNAKNSNYQPDDLKKFFDIEGRNEVMAYLNSSNIFETKSPRENHAGRKRTCQTKTDLKRSKFWLFSFRQ